MTDRTKPRRGDAQAGTRSDEGDKRSHSITRMAVRGARGASRRRRSPLGAPSRAPLATLFSGRARRAHAPKRAASGWEKSGLSSPGRRPTRVRSRYGSIAWLRLPTPGSEAQRQRGAKALSGQTPGRVAAARATSAHVRDCLARHARTRSTERRVDAFKRRACQRRRPGTDRPHAARAPWAAHLSRKSCLNVDARDLRGRHGRAAGDRRWDRLSAPSLAG